MKGQRCSRWSATIPRSPLEVASNGGQQPYPDPHWRQLHLPIDRRSTSPPISISPLQETSRPPSALRLQRSPQPPLQPPQPHHPLAQLGLGSSVTLPSSFCWHKSPNALISIFLGSANSKHFCFLCDLICDARADAVQPGNPTGTARVFVVRPQKPCG